MKTMVVRGTARRKLYSCMRAVLFLFLTIFMVTQLLVSTFSSVSKLSRVDNNTISGDPNTVVLSMVPPGLHKFLTTKPHNGSLKTAWEIQRQIDRYNFQQTIINEEVYGPLTNESLIIIVQVHTRVRYLRHLIVSLAQARDIDTVLLIFSHDFYDEEINDLVQSIDFCKVMQIFYPFSIQTHPDTFPGESPNDCPRNMNREDAVNLGCNNALHPDLYGHYREAKFTQTKHHWWWKVNRVFSELEVTKNFQGLVLFIEEDHFVAEDFLHILNVMLTHVKTACAQCNILSLGTYLKTYNYYADAKRAEITPWISSKHNMGMAFNRTVFDTLVRCAPVFCSFDDYNWDFSLQQVSNKCLKNKLVAFVLKGPRIFHIGECGVHHKNNCETTAVVSQVQRILQKASKHFYPDRLSVTYSTAKKKPLKKGNGGWGDLRDQELCLNMTHYSPSNILR